jgi:hypothetical protein
MPFDGSRQQPRSHEGLSLRHQVFHALRLPYKHLFAWRAAHRRETLPDAVVIGTLRRPTRAIAMRATVVPTETTPPPMREFLRRIVAHPLRPYCPRGSLPLEPWQAEHRADGTPIGYECRPCGTQIRWTPADVLQQMQREVRRHYAQYWAQCRTPSSSTNAGRPTSLRADARWPRRRTRWGCDRW